MTDAYDPADDKPKSSHVSKKELKWVFLILVLIGALLFPIYKSMLGQSEKHLCKQNFRGIANAMNLYAASNDDRFPPAYVMEGGTSPLLDAKRRPFTWASLISEYMGDRTNFKCRSADASENTIVQHRTDSKKEIECSYGYYAARTGQTLSTLRNPQQAVMVTESSSQGAMDSYNPLPLMDMDGKPAPDGFLIGYNDSNEMHTNRSTAVTRLAFKGSARGEFGANVLGRHEGENFFMFADGHAATHGALKARLQMLGSQIDGFWATR